MEGKAWTEEAPGAIFVSEFALTTTHPATGDRSNSGRSGSLRGSWIWDEKMDWAWLLEGRRRRRWLLDALEGIRIGFWEGARSGSLCGARRALAREEG